MRALVLLVIAVAACDLDDAPTPAPPSPRVQAAASQKALDECRDGCEQSAILTQASDATLRACRAGCDARLGVAATPHEVPSRITRAAPAHAPPAVRPRGRTRATLPP